MTDNAISRKMRAIVSGPLAALAKTPTKTRHRHDTFNRN